MRLTTRLLLLLFPVVAMWLTLSSATYAGAGTTRIVITGGDLPEEVVIADHDVVSQFHVWTRNFIDWGSGVISEPPTVDLEYRVTLYVHTPAFQMNYAPAQDGGSGYIFIPASGNSYVSGDSDRWNPNGKWQYATPEWDAFMLDVRSVHSAAVPPLSPSWAGIGSMGLAAIGLAAGAGALAWFGLRPLVARLPG